MKKSIFLILMPFLLFAQVKVTTLSGKADNTVYSNGEGNQSTYLFPSMVAVVPNNIVYAVDEYVNVIRKIDAVTGTTSQFCGNSTFTSPSFASGYFDGTSTTTLFSNITAITTDRLGNIFVVDNNRIRRITSSGNCTTITSNQSEFRNPEALYVDALGNIFVCDTGNKRIRRVTSSGVISTFATGFVNPTGITQDTLGNFYVCDGTEVKKVTSAGSVSVFASGFSLAYSVCIDSAGNLSVTDRTSHQVKKVSPLGFVSIEAGNGIPRFRDGDAGLTRFNASFYEPCGIAIDTLGNKYVADRSNQRIRKVR